MNTSYVDALWTSFNLCLVIWRARFEKVENFEIRNHNYVTVREWAKLTIDNGIYVAPSNVRCRGLIDSAFDYLPQVASSSPRGGTFNFMKCYNYKVKNWQISVLS